MGMSDCCEAEVKTTIMPTHATNEVGIPLVLFNSVREKTCSKCGQVISRTIQHPDRLIAAAAVSRCAAPEKLVGSEIRFLRKSLEKSAKELAKFLGVSAETLSRWENDKAPMNPLAERLLRLFVGTELRSKAPAIEFDAHSVLQMQLVAIRRPCPPMVFEIVKYKVRPEDPAEQHFEQSRAA